MAAASPAKKPAAKVVGGDKKLTKNAANTAVKTVKSTQNR